MFPRAVFEPPTEVLRDIENELRQQPKLLATAIKRNTSRLAKRWEAALQVEPAPAINYAPLRYKTPRQRRKVHAMREERGGGAYQRTHRLRDGWKVKIEPIDKGGEVTVTNKAPEAVFVYGTDTILRQPTFDPSKGGVPWLDPDVVNRTFAAQFGDVLEATVFTIGDPRAGVR